MTGIDKIKNKILADAKAKALALEEQAQREAEESLRAASEAASLKKAQHLAMVEEDGEEMYRRLLAVARLEGRKEILRAKQEIVEGVFKSAMEKIINLPDREYSDFLIDTIAGAAGNGDGEILLSEKDSTRVGDAFPDLVNEKLKGKGITGRLVLSPERIHTVGGFILRYGEMEINGTLEIIFDIQRPKLESGLVKILFGN